MRGSVSARRDCLAIEDFARAKVGEFRFLRATATGFGIQAAKPFEWDLAGADSDGTKSTAQGEYADVRAGRR